MNIEQMCQELKLMTVNELREKYLLAFGEETCSRNKDFLIKRIAWRLQANEKGDLSKYARNRALSIANDADLRIRMPQHQMVTGAPVARRPLSDARIPAPGTSLCRNFKGKNIEVTIQERGFEYEGETYKSLSAVALAATGTKWNGYKFFNL